MKEPTKGEQHFDDRHRFTAREAKKRERGGWFVAFEERWDGPFVWHGSLATHPEAPTRQQSSNVSAGTV